MENTQTLAGRHEISIRHIVILILCAARLAIPSSAAAFFCVQLVVPEIIFYLDRQVERYAASELTLNTRVHS
jgi:hypothetical protein